MGWLEVRETAVRPWLDDGLGPGGLPLPGHGHAERVIRAPHHRILAGRQDDLRLKVLDHQVGALGRRIAHHQHDAEILAEEADIPGDHHHPRDGRHHELLPGKGIGLEAKALDAQVGDLGLGQLERIGDDGGEVGELGLGEPGHPHLSERHLLGRGQRRQEDGEVHLDLLSVRHRKGRREVVGLEVGPVEDDPLLPDLVGRQRPGLDLGHQELLDHLDRHVLRRAIEENLAVMDHPDILQRVDAGDGQRRDIELRVGPDGELDRFGEARPSECGHHHRLGRQRWDLVVGQDGDLEIGADDGGDVLGHGLMRGLYFQAQAVEDDLFFGEEAALVCVEV